MVKLLDLKTRGRGSIPGFSSLSNDVSNRAPIAIFPGQTADNNIL